MAHTKPRRTGRSHRRRRELPREPIGGPLQLWRSGRLVLALLLLGAAALECRLCRVRRPLRGVAVVRRTRAFAQRPCGDASNAAARRQGSSGGDEYDLLLLACGCLRRCRAHPSVPPRVTRKTFANRAIRSPLNHAAAFRSATTFRAVSTQHRTQQQPPPFQHPSFPPPMHI